MPFNVALLVIERSVTGYGDPFARAARAILSPNTYPDGDPPPWTADYAARSRLDAFRIVKDHFQNHLNTERSILEEWATAQDIDWIIVVGGGVENRRGVYQYNGEVRTGDLGPQVCRALLTCLPVILSL